MSAYDAVIVGAGAGGCIAACVLAEAGKRVLLVERGRLRGYSDSGHRDHLRNHRVQRYGLNAGPYVDGNPRIHVDANGEECLVRPHEEAYSANASVVGGGTLLYGGLAWRFHPGDFRMATLYGVPAGSSLVDWPFGYEELEPWYDRAEWEIGVAGLGGANRHEGARSRGYPMPPVSPSASTGVLGRGAAALGIGTFPPPLLINTVPRSGRRACVECGSCVGFPCPSDAKNGTHNTALPRALATGLCELLTDTVVAQINTNKGGCVTGVDVLEAKDGDWRRRRVAARSVVVSAGAIETARLLLLSASDREPHGLGNGRDLVGRNLQGHTYPISFGLFEEVVETSYGPGVTIASCDYNHGNEGIVGGAMLADDFVMTPVEFWKTALPPDLPRYGLSAKLSCATAIGM